MNSLLRKAEDGFPELAQKRPAAPQKWPCRLETRPCFQKVLSPHWLARCPGLQITREISFCLCTRILLAGVLLSLSTPSLTGWGRKGPLRGTSRCVTNPFPCFCVTFNYSLNTELSVLQLQTNEILRSLQIGDYQVQHVILRSVWMVLKLWLLHDHLLFNLKPFHFLFFKRE